MQNTRNITAALIAEDDAFDLLSPSPFADLGFDPFAPTCTADLDAMNPGDPFAPTAAALNEEGDGFFDLLGFDPFTEEEAAERAHEAGELAVCCPCHGPHEVDEDGVPFNYCARCEKWGF